MVVAATAAAPRISPEAAARARQLMESAVAHERIGRNQKAVEELSQAIASRALSRADAARAMFDRGVAYDALGNTRAAVSDYSSALRLDPALAAALNNRANAYRRLGRLDLAQRDYRAALRSPGVAREYPYCGLGLISEKLGDIETARDYFHKALAVNPSFALAAQSLAGLKKSEIQLRPPAVHDERSAAVAAAVQQRPVEASPRGPSAPAAAGLAHTVTARPGPALRKALEERGGPSVMVQLGAYRDEQTALAGWERIAAASAGALQGLSPTTVMVDLPGKGRFWRLRTAVPDRAAARKLCESLAERNQACLLAVR